MMKFVFDPRVQFPLLTPDQIRERQKKHEQEKRLKRVRRMKNKAAHIWP